MFRKTLIFLLACLASLFPAVAQDADKGLRMRLFTVALQPDQGKVQIMAGDKSGPAFELPVFNLTESMPVAARKFKLVAVAMKWRPICGSAAGTLRIAANQVPPGAFASS